MDTQEVPPLGGRYLKKSHYEKTLPWAKSHGYKPCKVCKPPRQGATRVPTKGVSVYKPSAIVLAASVVSLSAVACGSETTPAATPTTTPATTPTTGGGATWSAQTSGSDADLSAVAFPNASHGWAVGNKGAILATTNGGTPQ